jgi:hypothetical protein
MGSVESPPKHPHHSPHSSLVLFTEQHVIGKKRVLQNANIPKPAWVNPEPLSQDLPVLFFGGVHDRKPHPCCVCGDVDCAGNARVLLRKNYSQKIAISNFLN